MPTDRPSLTVTLTDGGRERTVARMTGGDRFNDIELKAMPPGQTGVTAMALESVVRALRARVRGVDGMPGLDFDGQYRPLATVRQVRAAAGQLAAMVICLDGGGRVDPAEAYDRLDADARRTLTAMARQVLAAARKADI